MSNVRSVFAVATLAVSMAVSMTACQTSQPEQPATDQPTKRAEPAAKSDAGAAGKPADTGARLSVDTCGVLTSEEITGVIGRHDGGTGSGSNGGAVGSMAMCKWVNEDTFDTVVLLVGSEGTAPGGRVATDPGTAAPGPDGLVVGKPADNAKFAAGDRICMVQILTGGDVSRHRPTLTRLADLVRDRV